jgi:hypothetical protein
MCENGAGDFVRPVDVENGLSAGHLEKVFSGRLKGSENSLQMPPQGACQTHPAAAVFPLPSAES